MVYHIYLLAFTMTSKESISQKDWLSFLHSLHNKLLEFQLIYFSYIKLFFYFLKFDKSYAQNYYLNSFA